MVTRPKLDEKGGSEASKEAMVESQEQNSHEAKAPETDAKKGKSHFLTAICPISLTILYACAWVPN